VVRVTRDWFQAFILVATALGSILALVNMSRFASTTVNNLPVVVRYLFVAWLAVSCIITLWGMFRHRYYSDLDHKSWDRLVRSLLTERAGLIMLGSLALIYVAMVWVLFGGRALQSSLIWLGIAVASYLRVWDLSPGRARRKADKHGD
jgi:hypothetical protein